MREMTIQGWLCHDEDGLIAVKNTKRANRWSADSIQEIIEDFVSKKVERYDDDSLGGRRMFIPNVAMRLYVTDKRCTLDEAVGSLISHMYGDLQSDIGYEGYSEWTITGYYCKEFRIGGHDLAKELERYIDKYIHLVVEYER